MKKPDRPQVTGALAPYAEGFRRELSRQGYSPWTAPEHMYLMADLSRWLDGRDLSPDRLSPARIEEFLIHRQARGQARWTTPRALVPLLGYLRGLGIVPAPAAPAPGSPAEVLLVEFAGYLATERGLGSATIASYRHLAGLFLGACAPEPAVVGCGLKRLEPQQINTFLLTECPQRSIGSAKNLVTAVRVLMRFLYLAVQATRASRLPNQSRGRFPGGTAGGPGRLSPGRWVVCSPAVTGAPQLAGATSPS
jgi:integrase/recombinase XerD